MVDRILRPIVPTELADEREHRRQLAIRASASMPKDGTEGMTAPLKVMPYAVADLPTASLFPGAIVHQSTANVPAFSDGNTWKPLAAAADVAADIAVVQADLDIAEADIVTAEAAIVTLQTDLDAAEATLAAQAYTSGTWTPSIAFGGSTTGVTYSTRTGTYIKIGKLVQLSGHMVLTNNGTGVGAATISGFSTTPGTAATVASHQWVGVCAGGGGIVAASFNAPYCRLLSAGTVIGLYRGDNATNVLDDGDISNTALISISIMYQAA